MTRGDTVIAVFSDVHGNTAALQAVLAEIDRLGADRIVDLGDVASGGVDPRGTLELLRGRPDIVTVRGNHERQLLALPRDRMGRSDRFAAERLTSADVDWLRALPRRVEPIEGVLAFHGAPDDDLRYLLETVEAGLREATEPEVIERLGADAGRYRLYLCGHTHLQRTRRLADGAIVVNPGSVGWPAYEDDVPAPHKVEAGTPHARFTLVQSTADGWLVEEHAIEYDVEVSARLAEQAGRPDVAFALRTGRVGP